MKSLFLPNRLAAYAAFLTGIATGVGSLENAFPNTASTIGAVVATLGSIATCLHFMAGSQKVDALASQEKVAQIHAATQVSAPVPVTAQALEGALDWPTEVAADLEFSSIPEENFIVSVSTAESPDDYMPESALSPGGQPEETPVA
jgi:hypothetical protein